MKVGEGRRLRGAVALIAAVITLFALPATAGAVDFTVDSLQDPPPDIPSNANGCEAAGGDECTFREAIAAANALDAGNPPPGCTADLDRIFFSPSLNGGTIQRTQNEPIIAQSPFEIIGPGAGLLTLSGADTDDGVNRPILDLNPLCGITQEQLLRKVSGLRFTEGAPAIRLDNSADWIQVEDSVFHNNGPFPGGGAISNRLGRLIVRRSTFTENDSEGASGGGAILSGDLGVLGSFPETTIQDSTFRGNLNSSGGGGGAVASNSSRLVIQRSTFHENTGAESSQAGGGGAIKILVDRILDPSVTATTITDSTVTNNHDVSGLGGGAIRVVPAGLGTTLSTTVEPGPVTIMNTVIYGNTREAAGPDEAPDDIRADAGGVDFFTHNLIGTTADANLPADLSTVIVGQDPQLGSLAANGGPTLTRAPLSATSPVVDAGLASFTLDQRGLPRPADWAERPNAIGGNGSDIGAVELQLPPVNPPDPPAGDPPKQPTKKKCKKAKKKKGKKGKRKKGCAKKKKKRKR